MNTLRHYTRFSIKDAILTLSYATCLALPLSACNDSSNQAQASPTPHPPAQVSVTPTVQEGFSLNSLLNSLEEASKGVQVAVAPHADAVQTRTKEEVDKLFRWEYRVAEVPTHATAAELEGELTKLGNDGWECFDITQTQNNQTRLTCKRRPKSALSYFKYIPGL